MKVHYFSDHSVRGGIDSGFGIPVTWDVPLLDGYRSEFISKQADLKKPRSVRIPDPEALLQKEKYDCVFIHGYTRAFERQLICAARRVRAKVIMRGEFSDARARSRIKAFARNIYLRWFYTRVDAFCYIGTNAKEHLLRRRVPEKKLFFSPYSADTALLETQKRTFSRDAGRRDLGIGDSDFAFLFSGKLMPLKRPLLLLNALDRVPDKQKVHLIVLGDGELRDSTVELGHRVLGSRFHYCGFVNQSKLGKYFQAADAFVLPSERETWGLVVNEAMQYGLPAIVSDAVGCQTDLVEEGKTGFVFRSGSIEEFSSALQRAISNPQAELMKRNVMKQIGAYTTQSSVSGILRALQYVHASGNQSS